MVQETNCGGSIWVSDAVSCLHVCCRPPGWHEESVFPSFMSLHSLRSASVSKQTTMHQTSNQSSRNWSQFHTSCISKVSKYKAKIFSIWLYSPYCQLKNCTTAILGTYLIVEISNAKCPTCFTTYQGGWEWGRKDKNCLEKALAIGNQS